MLRVSLRLILCASLAMVLLGCATAPELKNAGPDFESAREAYVAGDYQRALPLMTAEAERGTPRAQYALGYMYFNGLGVDSDRDQAVAWIRRAANNGDPLAVEALSRMAVTMTRQTPATRQPAPADEAR
ncbi:SEL1-like repeat protein [Ectothiorhodospiraceae bacterium WFHF3C12]|nr:SEL1-like repeat protein [Ectothiorhodospiraceae bacterium WFHF3C12]